MSSSALIPDEYSDFRTKKFWEGFFVAREGKAFEWYGDYTTLASLLSTSVPDTNAKVLVPGCGNSELSADLYDAGYEHIVNVDFSETCVREMLMQNVRKRPKMRWLVMDMTDMKAFQDASFAAVVDKGSLDALMGDAEDEGGNVAGMRFLCEVRRVLDTKCGTYVIVTLCQDHVLETILDSFSVLADENIAGDSKPKWSLCVCSIPVTRDMRDSPWKPFAVVATRKADGTGGGGEGRGGALADVSFDFETYAVGKRRGPETEQMLNCRKVVERWERRAGQRMAAALHRAERVRKVERALSGVRAGQRVELDLPVDVPGHHGGSLAAPLPARFRASVLDFEGGGGGTKKKPSNPCAVFLVPQGREHEWLFSDREGQVELLAGCGVERLVVVSLLRGQAYGGMEDIQAELNGYVSRLAPSSLPDGFRIPYLTIKEGLGSRTEVGRTRSEMNGTIVVEDVDLEGEGGTSRRYRRMVFLDSSSLIQSEALIRDGAAGQQSEEEIIDHAYLSCRYHHAICAVAALAPRPEGGKERSRCLVVGLGGGGLSVFLSRQLPCDVTTVELDPSVEELARAHFGFREAEQLRSVVGCGLEAVRARADREGGALDLLVVDASGSASESISCPPASFLMDDFLASAAKALREGGIMAVNVVCRSENAFEGACRAISGHFSDVFFARLEDDVNKVVLAFKGEERAGAKAVEVARAAGEALRERQGTKAHRTDLLSCLERLERA